MRSLTIQISTPCHERWARMQPTEQGRFCDSCRKTVVDYSALSDRELVRLLSQPSATTCGRFRNEQLNRPLAMPDPATKSVWQPWVGLLTLGLFSWQTAQAQVSETTNPARTVTVLPGLKHIEQFVRDTTNQATVPTITGTVADIDSAGRQMLLPGATVVIRGANRGVVTDYNGAFRLKIPGDLLNGPITIVVSSVGFVTQEIVVNAIPQHLSIALREDEEALNQLITVGGYHVSGWQKIKAKLFHNSR